MVTLRTYLNPAEAALAKSLLDEHKVFCSLADESVNLYGGGPMAMPIRLLVADEQAEEAGRILAGEAEPSFPDDLDSSLNASEVAAETEQLPDIFPSHNPWELLVMAALFLLPGIYLLLHKYPLSMVPERRFRGAVLATSVTHGVGWFAVLMALSLTLLYFYTRHALDCDEETGADSSRET